MRRFTLGRLTVDIKQVAEFLRGGGAQAAGLVAQLAHLIFRAAGGDAVFLHLLDAALQHMPDRWRCRWRRQAM